MHFLFSIFLHVIGNVTHSCNVENKQVIILHKITLTKAGSKIMEVIRLGVNDSLFYHSQFNAYFFCSRILWH